MESPHLGRGHFLKIKSPKIFIIEVSNVWDISEVDRTINEWKSIWRRIYFVLQEINIYLRLGEYEHKNNFITILKVPVQQSSYSPDRGLLLWYYIWLSIWQIKPY